MTRVSEIRKRKHTNNKVHELKDSVSYIDKAGAVPTSEREKYLEFVIDLARIRNDNDTNQSYISNKQWNDEILSLRKNHKIHPRKAQIKKLYEELLSNGRIETANVNLEQYLVIKPSRSLSGILVIAVVMSPYPIYIDKKTGKIKKQKFTCKHNCYYCPNEPGIPRSYLSKEAAVSRAKRADFGAIDQFYQRANTLQKLGHDIDKIELLILGGTFNEYPIEYQQQFIRDLFWSANTFYDGFDDFKLKRARKSLFEEIKIHETATKCRIVGLTLETRPDSIRDFETIRRFREYGATRLQIGVQHIEDNILKKINRGCVNSDTIKAVRLLKNCGYKIDIHLMPNLPGSTPQKDIEMFNKLLSSDLIQCDQWKVYPCQTVDFSIIKKWYENGEYKPYSLEKLMDVIIDMKSKIHPWIRLNRIFRSFPAEYITSGITMSNFRQYMYQKMNKKGLKCKCIRCREIGSHIRRHKNEIINDNTIILKKRQYKSSGGDEIFISFESKDETILYGFVRLRLPPINEHNIEYKSLIKTFPELNKAALIREIHVYGHKQNVKQINARNGFGNNWNMGSKKSANANINETNNISSTYSSQSKGYGTQLMVEAENIAKYNGYKRMAVIAGIGARCYYRLKLGYKCQGTYMIKDLHTNTHNNNNNNENNENNYIAHGFIISLVICFALYILSTKTSIILSLIFACIYIGYLDYLHFIKIEYNKTVDNTILGLTRLGLVLLNLSVFFKICSAFLPRGPIISEILNGNCYCRIYWSLSLILYVTAFYLLKLIYHKRVLVLIQDPMFGNDQGIKQIPTAMISLLTSQILLFSLCSFLVLNYVDSYCTDTSINIEYDQQTPWGCHDTFEAIDTWFAIVAIIFDAILFAMFCNKWYGIMLIFMEKMATSLLVQFCLVIIAMISCIGDASFHLFLLYSNKDDTNNFDSYLGTPAFVLDCSIMASCLVLSFTDSQKYLMNKIGTKDLNAYYQSLENLGYTLHIM